MTMIAIIPARGGSKGVPRKNLRLVAGRSLLERAIAACRGAPAIARTIVSTDDAEIAEAARKAGAEVPFMRPPELASDTAPTIPVLQHAVRALEAAGAAVASIALVEATSPFRTAVHVQAAAARFAEGDCRAVLSVMPLTRKPENIFVKERHLRRYIEQPDIRYARRQDMAHLCRLNSALYVVGRDDLIVHATLSPPPIGWIEMTELESLNIDSPIDLDMADFLARKHGL